MRNFLAVLQTITDALPREDMKEIARAARSMGSGAANEIPPQTVAKLPEEFKVLAGGVHTIFDLIALDAESLADPKHTHGADERAAAEVQRLPRHLPDRRRGPAR